MVVSQPKKRLSKEEIIEILRRNAQLFKNEPEFVTYIVDLAMYLIENFLELKETQKDVPERNKVSTREIKAAYDVFERFGTEKPQQRTCPVCGVNVENKRKCPNCNSMTF